MLLGTVLDTRSHHSDILLRHGGLWLYDLCVPQGGRGRFDPLTVRARLRAALRERAWVMLTQDGAMLGKGDAAPVLHRRVGNVVLVHAGVQPQAAEPETWIETSDPLGIDDDHPLWIRAPFLGHRGAFGDGLFVVHGHTPEHRTVRHNGSRAALGEHPYDGWRLGLDGGSSVTGIVSAAILRDGRYRVVACHEPRTETQA